MTATFCFTIITLFILMVAITILRTNTAHSPRMVVPEKWDLLSFDIYLFRLMKWNFSQLRLLLWQFVIGVRNKFSPNCKWNRRNWSKVHLWQRNLQSYVWKFKREGTDGWIYGFRRCERKICNIILFHKMMKWWINWIYRKFHLNRMNVSSSNWYWTNASSKTESSREIGYQT